MPFNKRFNLPSPLLRLSGLLSSGYEVLRVRIVRNLFGLGMRYVLCINIAGALIRCVLTISRYVGFMIIVESDSCCFGSRFGGSRRKCKVRLALSQNPRREKRTSNSYKMFMIIKLQDCRRNRSTSLWSRRIRSHFQKTIRQSCPSRNRLHARRSRSSPRFSSPLWVKISLGS